MADIGTDAIVFSRSRLDGDGTPRNSALRLVTSAGTRALTAAAVGDFDSAASWSPHGTHLAYMHGSMNADAADRYDIVDLNIGTGKSRQLTAGTGNFVLPAWGPRNGIAFVSRYGRRNCVSLVDANGERQRDLFCPPSPARIVQAPMWSADGASLYVHAGYDADRLSGVWRSLAYRIDVTTGAAVVLGDGLLDGPRALAFAPDGGRGIYSDVYAGSMDLLDFASGRMKSIGHGYAPHWSPDGKRIAFTGEVYESNPPDDFRFYEPLYVMDANGTNKRHVTSARVDNLAYTAVQWSRDGVHVLVNRRIYLDESLTIPRYALRIVNVDTGKVKVVTGGQADAGGWFER